MILHKYKLITIILLGSFIMLGLAAIRKPLGEYKNLQVLPQDIPSQKLDSIMHTYNVALGVNCKFCHVSMKNIPDSLDFASDAEPMKEQARKMMRMNIYINKTYFYFNKEERPEYLMTVTCNTCHRGETFPEQR
jgi:Photosynthetic reaction centre cytochrome C subunit